MPASKRFYETLAPFVGVRLSRDLPERVQFSGAEGSCSFVAGDEPSENVHLAFPVPDDTTVDAFWQAGVAAGYSSNGEPGERVQYHAGYHGAYLLDPDGNNVEAVCHNR